MRRALRGGGSEDSPMEWLTCNTPFRNAVAPETLAAILRGEREPGGWAPHLRAFFRESTVEQIARLLAAYGVPREAAKRCYLRHVKPWDPRPEIDDYFGP